jgi:hypothetical protein
MLLATPRNGSQALWRGQPNTNWYIHSYFLHSCLCTRQNKRLVPEFAVILGRWDMHIFLAQGLVNDSW